MSGSDVDYSSLAKALGAIGTAAAGVIAFLRGRKAEQARQVAEEAKRESTTSKTAVDGFNTLVTAMQGEMSRLAASQEECMGREEKHLKDIRDLRNEVYRLQRELRGGEDL